MNDLAQPVSFRDDSLVRSQAPRRRRVPLLLLFAAAALPATLGLTACKSPSQKAAELAQQADAYAQSGNLVAARDAISQAIALREDEASYHQLAGSISMGLGEPVRAYRAFQRALEFDATNRIALAYVANLGVQVGQVAEAEDAADRLLTLEPDALPALQVKGMIALSRNKFEDARGYADRILAVNPTDPAGSVIKARSLAKEGKAEEGLALIDSALASGAESMPLLVNKLNMYRYLGQPEPMVPLAERLVDMSKGAPRFRLDQINLLYKLGRKDEARRASLALLAAGSRDLDDYRTLQRIWWQYDDTPLPDAAARDASRWKEPGAVVQTARYLFLKGDLAAADGLVRTAPRKAQPLLASLKARMFAAAGRREEAQRQVDALLAKDGQDVDALMLKAQFAQAAKDMDAAVEAAQLAQTNDPLNPETYVVLANVYRAQDLDWRAKQVFEDGFRALPQNFYLAEKYTQYLHQLGDRGRAMSVARTLARAMPSSEHAWRFFAAECQASGSAGCMQAAQAGLEKARTAILVDDPPGTPPDRGLFGRI
ncbi:tetratricopeptide repeat protein [Sphingobium sp. SYK-6]|uniref:tetratricopeptide repeat protein n=1 Tax=Sphingobium sp. (strain NBRC 103272 / SYK-6) TaxID=627192 RepID=UPI00059E2B6E|nr:tetratricopeptide repeat protein [Sphingobium sp. SYK-6]